MNIAPKGAGRCAHTSKDTQMPKITMPGGKVKHLPYTKKGEEMAKEMQKKGMKVTYSSKKK